MRFAIITAVALAGTASLPIDALAQPKVTDARQNQAAGINRAGNISASASQWTVSAALPSPRIGDEADAKDYLKCAYAALAVGRDDLARQSLEMAETRSLGGSMRKGIEALPGDIPKAFRIRDALHALGGGDRKQAIEFIKIAMLN
jgi:hypothetical protein